MAKADISMPISRALKRENGTRAMTVNVTITGLRIYQLRIRIAAQVFRFGAWIAGASSDVAVDFTEGKRW